MNNVMGFEYLEYAEFPERSVIDIAGEAGLGDQDVSILLENGLKAVPVCEQQDLSILIKKSLQKLSIHVGENRVRTKSILLLHSLPIVALETSDFLKSCCENTLFEKTPIIQVSGQPCAVFHYGVWLALQHLEQIDEKSNVLLIGIDIASSAENRFFFGSAMGDSLIYGVISSQNTIYRVIGTHSETYVMASKGDDSSLNTIAAFRAANPSLIRDAVERCLSKASVDLSEIDWIVPHTPYIKMGQIIASVLNFPSSKILMDYLPESGHLNSNDAFCHYKRACKEEKIVVGDIALLINPGFGGSRGITILERVGSNH